MVVCEQCGKRGWRYDMEISAGRWYCSDCHAKLQGEADSPAFDPANQEFLARHRVRLEFVRYLVRTGVLNEEVTEDEVIFRR